MSQLNRVFLAALTASLVASVTAPALADIIYRETYGRPAVGQPGTSSANILGDVFDWPTFVTSTTDPTLTMKYLTTAATGIGGVSGSTANGNPTNVANVNAGNNEDGTTVAYPRGFYFMANATGGANGSPDLAMTTEYQLNPANYSNLTFSWYQGNNDTTSPLQLAVRIAGQWYASTTQFTGPNVVSAGNFGTQSALEQVVFNPAAANWVTFGFDGDWNATTHTLTQDNNIPFAFGPAPSSDLSGTIDGFGLLAANPSSGSALTRRFDTFEIDGTLVPEPSSASLALLGLGGISLVLTAQRRCLPAVA